MTRTGPWIQPADVLTGPQSLNFHLGIWGQLRTGAAFSVVAAGGGTAIDGPPGTSHVADLSYNQPTNTWTVDVGTWTMRIGELLSVTTFDPVVDTSDPDAIGVEYEAPQGVPVGPLHFTSNVFVLSGFGPAEEAVTSLMVRHVPASDYTVVFDDGTAAGVAPGVWGIRTSFPASATLLGLPLLATSVATTTPPIAVDLDLADLDGAGLWVLSLSTNRHENLTPPVTVVSDALAMGLESPTALDILYRPPRYRFVYDDRTPLRGRQRASGVSGALPVRGRNNAPYGLRGRQESNR